MAQRRDHGTNFVVNFILNLNFKVISDVSFFSRPWWHLGEVTNWAFQNEILYPVTKRTHRSSPKQPELQQIICSKTTVDCKILATWTKWANYALMQEFQNEAQSKVRLFMWPAMRTHFVEWGTRQRQSLERRKQEEMHKGEADMDQEHFLDSISCQLLVSLPSRRPVAFLPLSSVKPLNHCNTQLPTSLFLVKRSFC